MLRGIYDFFKYIMQILLKKNLFFQLSLQIFFIQHCLRLCFGFRKVLRKEKIIKENYFLMFDFIMKNMKENQI